MNAANGRIAVACMQVLLVEMLSSAGVAERGTEPDQKRLGCHMAIFAELLRANAMGPLTVRPHTLTILALLLLPPAHFCVDLQTGANRHLTLAGRPAKDL